MYCNLIGQIGQMMNHRILGTLWTNTRESNDANDANGERPQKHFENSFLEWEKRLNEGSSGTSSTQFVSMFIFL